MQLTVLGLTIQGPHCYTITEARSSDDNESRGAFQQLKSKWDIKSYRVTAKVQGPEPILHQELPGFCCLPCSATGQFAAMKPDVGLDAKNSKKILKIQLKLSGVL